MVASRILTAAARFNNVAEPFKANSWIVIRINLL